MLKYLIIISALLFSVVSANNPPIKSEKIRQREVDLNKFQNHEVLRLAKEELNRHLPQKIDPYTTLVKVDTKDLTLIKTYEINSGSKSDETIKNEDHTRMRKAITKGTCMTSQRFLHSGISLSYIYISATSKTELFQFNVSRKDCPNIE